MLYPVYKSIDEYLSQPINSSTVPPNASYLASQLITRSWNLSGIVARELEVVSGQQASDGLYLLNEVLAEKSYDLKLIPYWGRIEFNLVQGQELIFIKSKHLLLILAKCVFLLLMLYVNNILAMVALIIYRHCRLNGT